MAFDDGYFYEGSIEIVGRAGCRVSRNYSDSAELVPPSRSILFNSTLYPVLSPFPLSHLAPAVPRPVHPSRFCRRL